MPLTIAFLQTQRGIAAFFQPEVYMQPAKTKSKRVLNVVEKIKNPVELPDNDNSEGNLTPLIFKCINVNKLSMSIINTGILTFKWGRFFLKVIWC